MSFILQYTCPECGYKTPECDDRDALIGSLGMESCFICSCNECNRMFNRGNEPVTKDDCIDAFLDSQGEEVHLRRHCKFCGSPNIVIYVNDRNIPCPICNHRYMKGECVGTGF